MWSINRVVSVVAAISLIATAVVAQTESKDEPKKKDESKKEEAKAETPAGLVLTTERTKVGEGLFVVLHCRVASGKGAEEATAVLDAGGVVSPVVRAAAKVLSPFIKLIALKKGTMYCTAWRYGDPFDITPFRHDALTFNQKVYSAKQGAIGARTAQECRRGPPLLSGLCVTKGLVGGPTVDGLTVCADIKFQNRKTEKLEAKSFVAALGSGTDKIDAAGVRDGLCKDRKF
jgi:hypothetical protein